MGVYHTKSRENLWLMLSTECPYTGLFTDRCKAGTCLGTPHAFDTLTAKSLDTQGHLSATMFDFTEGLKTVSFSGTWVDPDYMRHFFQRDNKEIEVNLTAALAINNMSPSFKQHWDGFLGIAPLGNVLGMNYEYNYIWKL